MSKNFKSYEYACPCGCGKEGPMDPYLMYMLQKLEDKLKKTIYITKGGGIRCEEYNQRIGGYIKSPHKKGKAIDVTTVDISKRNINKMIELAEMAKKIGFKRIGLYPYSGFLHLDVAEIIKSESWIRDLQGRYIYFASLEGAVSYIKKYILKKN